MDTKIHIGQMIKAKMKEDGRSVQWLARKLHCVPSNIYKIYEKQTLDSGLLQRIREALGMDCLVCLSNSVKQK